MHAANLSELEQEELEGYVQKKVPFSAIPERARKLVGNNEKGWRQYVQRYSIQHQLRWKTNMVREIVNSEKTYYEDLIKWSREHLMLYPYHLSDVLVKGLRLAPFKYYLDMMADVMKSERSYDSLPNFTAADCLRLLGIGRNQFIDTMNAMRAKSWLWKKKRNALYELLPAQPIPIEIEHWWLINIGYVSEDDVRNSTKAEHAAIDMLIDMGPLKAGQMEKSVVHSLHTKGLIYIDVPIKDDDYIIIPPLEGFVMNRVLGDYFENLLYNIFISIDEQTTIRQLANILQIDIKMVKQALSMYIRLGFAKKRNVEELTFDTLGAMADPTPESSTVVKKFGWHSTWMSESNGKEKSFGSPSLMKKDLGLGATSQNPKDYLSDLDIPTHCKRIAFMFDSTITAYLMMGNLGAGLKTHAVTMFERGKLADESMDILLSELEAVSPEAEGEAQRYVDHAICLKDTLKFLRHNEGICGPNVPGGLGLDLIRCERINSLDENTRLRVLEKNYSILVSMAPVAAENQNATRVIPRHFGPPMPEVNSVWFCLHLYNLIGRGPPTILYPKGARVTQFPKSLKKYGRILFTTWNHEPTVINANYLLLTLNDALLSSPVCIQGYSYGEQPAIVHIPFPIDFNDKSDTAAWRFPSIKKLHDELSLQHFCGYITMINPALTSRTRAQSIHSRAETINEILAEAAQQIKEKKQAMEEAEKEKEIEIKEKEIESDNNNKDNNNNDDSTKEKEKEKEEEKKGGEGDEVDEGDWVFLTVSLGIPLFDPRLNAEVCNKIEKHHLFYEENILLNTKYSGRMCNGLLDFIEGNQAPDYRFEVEPGIIPYPTRVVEFNGRTLCK